MQDEFIRIKLYYFLGANSTPARRARLDMAFQHACAKASGKARRRLPRAFIGFR